MTARPGTATGPERSTAWVVRALVVLTGFGFVSAVLGMVLALSGGGGFPAEYLDRTPFSSTVVPGLILGVVVGGTQALAAYSLVRGQRHALLHAGVAGCALIIWIFAELAMLMEYSVLQTVYLGVGLAEAVAVMALLGIEPDLVAPWPAARRSRLG